MDDWKTNNDKNIIEKEKLLRFDEEDQEDDKFDKFLDENFDSLNDDVISLIYNRF